MPFWCLHVQKKCKNAILTFKMTATSQGQGQSFEVIFPEKVPLTQAISLSSFIEITNADLKKSAKMFNLAPIWVNGSPSSLSKYSYD